MKLPKMMLIPRYPNAITAAWAAPSWTNASEIAGSAATIEPRFGMKLKIKAI